MDSRQLRYFSAICEHGTLTRAAEHCRVAVSALSHHVANLEAELSTQLFIRKPRGMEMTAAGHRLNGHAKAILRAMAAAARDLDGAGDDISGEVAVGMAYSAMKAIGVSFTGKILADYPRLRLSLSEGMSGQTLTQLLSSELDVAVLYNPPNDARLKLRPILEEELWCIGRPDIIGRGAQSIRFDAMLKLPMIILKQGISGRALTKDATLQRKLEANAKVQMNSVQAINGSLVAGLGCAVGTRLAMQEPLASGALHARPISHPSLSRTLCLCELVDRPATFALEAVSKLIVQQIRQAVDSGHWPASTIVNGQGPVPQ